MRTSAAGQGPKKTTRKKPKGRKPGLTGPTISGCVGRSKMDRDEERPRAMPVDELQGVVHEQVGERAVEAGRLAGDLQSRVHRRVAAAQETEEVVVAVA